MIRRPIALLTLSFSLLCASAWALTSVVPSGTEIKVRTDQPIQASAANAGRSQAALARTRPRRNTPEVVRWPEPPSEVLRVAEKAP